MDKPTMEILVMIAVILFVVFVLITAFRMQLKSEKQILSAQDSLNMAIAESHRIAAQGWSLVLQLLSLKLGAQWMVEMDFRENGDVYVFVHRDTESKEMGHVFQFPFYMRSKEAFDYIESALKKEKIL